MLKTKVICCYVVAIYIIYIDLICYFYKEEKKLCKYILSRGSCDNYIIPNLIYYSYFCTRKVILYIILYNFMCSYVLMLVILFLCCFCEEER